MKSILGWAVVSAVGDPYFSERGGFRGFAVLKTRAEAKRYIQEGKERYKSRGKRVVAQRIKKMHLMVE